MLNEAPRKKKEQKPEEQIYSQKLDMNSCLHQAFQNLKEERNTGPWTLIEELKGVTMQRRGTDGFSVSYQKYFVGNQTDAQLFEKEAKKFLGDILKELKKHFKKLSGKVLEVKKIEESKNVDKYSRLVWVHNLRRSNWPFPLNVYSQFSYCKSGPTNGQSRKRSSSLGIIFEVKIGLYI